MEYFNKIIHIVKAHAGQEMPDPLNMIFLFKDIVTKNIISMPPLSQRLNILEGEPIPAGTAPRLTFARTETAWLLVHLPLLLENLKHHDCCVHIRIIVAYPESVVMAEEEKVYLANPILITKVKDIQKAQAFLHYFSQHGEDEVLKENLKFRLTDFFEIEAFQGFLPLNESSCMIVGSTPSTAALKMSMAINLQKASEQGVFVIEKPQNWFPDFLFKNYGYADPKSMAAHILPEYYPPSCEGRILYEAVHFFKRHEHIVFKPSSGANGYGVKFFNLQGVQENARQAKIQEFTDFYQKALEEYPDPVRLIVQPYLKDITQYGETRVFIYNRKIFPVGIRLYPEGEDAICKIFLNARLEEVWLEEDFLAIAHMFLERAKHLEMNYFGMDIIKSKGADGQMRYYVTELNHMISGFFDRIAYKMDHDVVGKTDYFANLSPQYAKNVMSDYLDNMFFRNFYDFLNHFFQKKCGSEIEKSDISGVKLIEMIKNIKNMQKNEKKFTL